MSDYTFNETAVIQHGAITKWITEIFQKCGMSEQDAYLCANSLTIADARGVYSHGAVRVPVYFQRYTDGGVDFTAKPEILKEAGATALVDGHDAMGQVACTFAMKLAIEKAREFGASAVSVTGSNHIGTCAQYVMQATEQDMIGFCWTINCGNIMAPYGGIDPMLGNNPFGIGLPCGKHAPIVLDMATSTVAKGKIQVACKTNTPIPDTWAIDKDGKPTTDPFEAYAGTVLPFGGYKGAGLSYINAMLSAVLSGSHFGADVTEMDKQTGTPNCTGHLLQVIDVSKISDVAAFKQRMDDAVDYIHSGRRAEGVKALYVPGELEALSMERQMAEGITYPIEVLDDIRAISEKLGVAPIAY